MTHWPLKDFTCFWPWFPSARRTGTEEVISRTVLIHTYSMWNLWTSSCRNEIWTAFHFALISSAGFVRDFMVSQVNVFSSTLNPPIPHMSWFFMVDVRPLTFAKVNTHLKTMTTKSFQAVDAAYILQYTRCSLKMKGTFSVAEPIATELCCSVEAWHHLEDKRRISFHEF